MEWIFSGIGTAIVTFILGLIFGGGIGYRVAINKKKIKQSQKAGRQSSQIQIGSVDGNK